MSSKELLPHNSERFIGDVIKYYGLSYDFVVEKINIGYTNKNFKITTDNDNYLFKIYKDKNPENLKYEIDLVNDLGNEGLPVRSYLKRTDNKYLTLTPHGYVSVSHFIEGVQPKINESTIIQTAQILGRLHNYQLPSEMERENPWGIPLIEKAYSKLREKLDFYPELKRPFLMNVDAVRNIKDTGLPQGLIHGDLFADNVVFNNDKLAGIIDFEAACKDVFIYDIGVAINGFCFDSNNSLNLAYMQLFLEKYAKQRKLNEKENEMLPIYIKIGTLAMIAYHLEYIYTKFAEKNYNRATYLLERVHELNKI